MLQMNLIKNWRKTNLALAVFLVLMLVVPCGLGGHQSDRKQLAELPLAQAASFRIAPVGAFDGREMWFSYVTIWKNTQTHTDSLKDQSIFLKLCIYRLVTTRVKIEQSMIFVFDSHDHMILLFTEQTIFVTAWCILYTKCIKSMYTVDNILQYFIQWNIVQIHIISHSW